MLTVLFWSMMLVIDGIVVGDGAKISNGNTIISER